MIGIPAGWIYWMQSSINGVATRNSSRFSIDVIPTLEFTPTALSFIPPTEVHGRADSPSLPGLIPTLDWSPAGSATPAPTDTPTVTPTMPNYLATRQSLEAALSLTPAATATLEPTGWVWIAPVTVVWLTTEPEIREVPVTVVVPSAPEERIVTRVKVVTPTATGTFTATPTSSPTLSPSDTPTLAVSATPEGTPEAVPDVQATATPSPTPETEQGSNLNP